MEALRDGAAGLEEGRERAFENQTDPVPRDGGGVVEAGQPDAALTFAERAKGRVLLDVLRHGRADVNRVMTPAERAEERRLDAATAEAAQRLQRVRARPGNDRAVADAERGLREARTSGESFRTTVYTAHPELKGQRSEAPAVGGGELAAMVPDEDTALVEFSVTPEAIFVFVVTAGDPLVTTVHRLAQSPGALQRLAADYVAALAGRDLGFRTRGGPCRAPCWPRSKRACAVDAPGRRPRRAGLEPAVSGADAERRPLRRAAVLGDLCHVADGVARKPARSDRQDVRPRSVAAFGIRSSHAAGRWEQRNQGRRAGAAAGCRA